MCMALKVLHIKQWLLRYSTRAFVEQIRGGEEKKLKTKSKCNYFQQIPSRRIVGTIERILNLVTKFRC